MNQEQQLAGLNILDNMIHECKMMREEARTQWMIAAQKQYGDWLQLTRHLHGFWVGAAMWAFLNPTSNTHPDLSEEQTAGYLRAKRNYTDWLAHKGGHPYNCVCAPCVYLDSLQPVVLQ